jgi:hypothetical protein
VGGRAGHAAGGDLRGQCPGVALAVTLVGGLPAARRCTPEVPYFHSRGKLVGCMHWHSRTDVVLYACTRGWQICPFICYFTVCCCG